jgi:predicted amidophosphoribosyltransferase
MLTLPMRFASSWQRLFCNTCREETIHRRNACIHCGASPSAKQVAVSAQYNGREMVSRLTDAQRTEARRMFNAGTPPKLIATKLHVSPSSVYRLNPLTRG